MVLLAAVTAVALTILGRDDLAAGDFSSNLGTALSAMAYATLGALIVRRAGNVLAGSWWAAARSPRFSRSVRSTR